MENNLWICDHYSIIGKTLSQYAVEKTGRKIHLSYAYAYLGKALEWYRIMWEHGGLGPAGETFNGGLGGRGQVDLEKAAEWHHKHGLYMSFTIDDHTMESGPISKIEGEVKEHVLHHKHMPKFAPGAKPSYWTPMAHADAAVAAFKKYGRYE